MLPVGTAHQYCDAQSWMLNRRSTGVQWGAQRAVGWEMKVPTELSWLQGQGAAKQRFSECKTDQGGIIRASFTEACSAELSCQPEPSPQSVPAPVTAGATQPGLSKLLINVLQFPGLDPSKELAVQTALEKFYI